MAIEGHKRPGRNGYLRAGVQLLNRASDPSSYLTIDRIADEAGVSTSAFNGFWGDTKRGFDGPKENYFKALVHHILDPEVFSSVKEVVANLATVASAEPMLDALKRVIKRDYELVRDEETNGALLLLVSGSRANPALGRALRGLYREFDHILETAIDQILFELGRKPVPPLSSRDLAVIFNSVIDGFTLRARFDEERATYETYERLVLSIVLVLTCDRDDDVSIDEKTALINTWAADAPL